MKTIIKFIIISVISAGLTISGIYGICYMIDVSQPTTDEIKVDQDGDNMAYLYHLQDDKLVDFGGPRFVMLEAHKAAIKNHSTVLKITPDYGWTVGGEQVTAGVYVTFLPIKE